MHEMKQRTAYIKDVVNNYIQHPFIAENIEAPFIDEYKLQLSYKLFQGQVDEWSSLEKYLIATLFIQIAIDIHEHIPGKDQPTLSEVEKQLSVLVGDYYSGMYYYILSELEDINMVGIVARSIKEVNEQKMNVYYHQVESFADLIDKLKIIESTYFVHLVKAQNDFALIPVIETFLVANRLQKERHKLLKGQFSYVERYLKEKNPLHVDESQMERMIEDAYDAKIYELREWQGRLDDKYQAILNWMMTCHEPTLKTMAIKEGL